MKRINLPLPNSLWARLSKQSTKTGQTKSKLVRHYLQNFSAHSLVIAPRKIESEKSLTLRINNEENLRLQHLCERFDLTAMQMLKAIIYKATLLQEELAFMHMRELTLTKLAAATSEQELLQLAVDTLSNDLHAQGVMIFKIEGTTIIPLAHSQSRFIKRVSWLIKKRIEDLRITFEHADVNVVARAAASEKTCYTEHYLEASAGAISNTMSAITSGLSGFASGFAAPLILEPNEPLAGVVFVYYSRKENSELSQEHASNIGTSVLRLLRENRNSQIV